MQTRKRYVIGNWKMNGDYALVLRMLALLRAAGPFQRSVPVICPPFTLLHAFADLRGTGELGAQDCSTAEQGARTGDISAKMLVEQQCKFVIVGHSEQRQYHSCTDEEVAAKTAMATAVGLVPIICVGETLAQRQAGDAEAIVSAQVKAALAPVKTADDIIIAYEPVWAIGTGYSAEPADISRMHDVISKNVQAAGQENVPILYGGSVKPEYAVDILRLPGVDGVLVGGASLDPDQFMAIAKVAESLA